VLLSYAIYEPEIESTDQISDAAIATVLGFPAEAAAAHCLAVSRPLGRRMSGLRQNQGLTPSLSGHCASWPPDQQAISNILSIGIKRVESQRHGAA
jgi:hypothetical protein